ncbi:MAG: FMN-binding protein [Coprobacillus sp.]
MKIVKLALFLAIVAGLSGAALSLVNSVTDPLIQEAAIASEKQNLVKIYSGGEEFKKVESNLADYPAIKDIYSAGDKGYVYKTSVQGYKGPVVILIGLDKAGTYKGFEIADISQETKGIGDKVADESYKKSIVGKNIGDSIDTISGATFTSKAVVDGIEQATAHYEENFK